MRTDIHPDYEAVSIRCSCGNVIETRSTGGDLSVELCSECHPFYTGKQKLVDTGGRIDRFERRYGRRKKAGGAAEEEAPRTDAQAPAPEAEAPVEGAPVEEVPEADAPAREAATAEAPAEVAASDEAPEEATSDEVTDAEGAES